MLQVPTALVDLDVAAHRARQQPADRQAKAGAGLRLRHAERAALERHEDASRSLAWIPGPVSITSSSATGLRSSPMNSSLPLCVKLIAFDNRLFRTWRRRFSSANTTTGGTDGRLKTKSMPFAAACRRDISDQLIEKLAEADSSRDR